MKTSIKLIDSTAVTGWPVRLHRVVLGKNDPADHPDCIAILNNPGDFNRGHVAVSDGRSWVPLGWLDEMGQPGTNAVPAPMPAPAMAVLDDGLRTAVENQRVTIARLMETVRSQGAAIAELKANPVSSSPAAAEEQTPPTKADLRAQVSQAAETQRARYATLYPGKDLSYFRKQMEALQVLASIDVEARGGPAFVPEPSKFGLLENQIGRYVPNTGNYRADIIAAAQLIMQRVSQCAAAEKLIDAEESDAKLAIEAATTHDAAVAAAQVEWPA